MKNIIISSLESKDVKVPQDYLMISGSEYFYEIGKIRPMNTFSNVHKFHEFCYDYIVDIIQSLDRNIYINCIITSINDMVYFINKLYQTNNFTVEKIVLRKREEKWISLISEDHIFERIAGYYSELGIYLSMKKYAEDHNIPTETINYLR